MMWNITTVFGITTREHGWEYTIYAWIDLMDPYIAYMGVDSSPLPQNDGNLTLPFFGGKYPIILLYNIL